MTRKPDDTEPSGAPDAEIESLLDGGAIDIRAEQASSDGLEQAHYYAQARAAQPRAHTKTDPLSNVIVEKTPRPAPDAITDITPRMLQPNPAAPPSTPRELVATEISVHRGGLEPSTARKIAAVFVGAAVVALGVAGIAFVLRSPAQHPAESRPTTGSASATTTTSAPPPASSLSTGSPSSAPSASTAGSARPPTTARAVSSVREPPLPTSAVSTTAPSPTPANSSAPPPPPSASVRYGGLVQEDVK